MREDPPAELIELLSRLKLADGAAIRSAAGRAKSLARGLPLFPSVWSMHWPKHGGLRRIRPLKSTPAAGPSF